MSPTSFIFATAQNPHNEYRWQSILLRGEEIEAYALAVGAAMAVFEEGWQVRTLGSLSNEGNPVTPHTYYDIASLTKIFTAWAAWQTHLLTPIFSEEAQKWYPLIPQGLTLSRLITHESGLTIKRKYYKDQHYTRAEIKQYLENKDNIYIEEQVKKRYCDLHYIYLGRCLERVHKKPLSNIIEELLAAHGIPEVVFAPRVPSAITAPTAAALISGVPHDEKARWYAEPLGHAGMFATLYGLMRFIDHLLTQNFPEEYWVAILDSTHSTHDFYSLGGWRTFYGGLTIPSMAGYTGPCIAIDPQRKKALIILTNVTYPHHNGEKRARYKAWVNSLFA